LTGLEPATSCVTGHGAKLETQEEADRSERTDPQVHGLTDISDRAT
jgi:hypothetical protein